MNLSKWLIGIGILFVLTGVLVWLAPKIAGLGRLGKLPGDIRVEGKGFTFYFPWVTCLLLSMLLTLVFQIFGGRK